MKRILLLVSCCVLLTSGNSFASAAGKDGKKAAEAAQSTTNANSAANQASATASQPHDAEIDTASASLRALTVAGAPPAAAAASALLLRRAQAPRAIATTTRRLKVLEMMVVSASGVSAGSVFADVPVNLYAANEQTPNHFKSTLVQDSTTGVRYKQFEPTLNQGVAYALNMQTPTGYQSRPCHGHKHFDSTL